MSARIFIYRRRDGLFDWHLKADNGQIVATSGSQGYSNHANAKEAADRTRELMAEVPDDLDVPEV